MSHFIGLVFGSDWKERLERYNENRGVEPYIRTTKENVISEAWKDIERYKNDGSHPETHNLRTDEEVYRWHIDYWEETTDKDGNIVSTYNPESKWDWYTIGGRWKGYLPMKGCETEIDLCKIGDVDWQKFFEDRCPFCFITPDGEWHQKGDMGWWGVVSNAKPEEEWQNAVKEYISNLPLDTPVVAIDFHI